ncbi:MAG TPA: hypothetical protein PKI94_03685 [Candidatus Gastranaerophilaceae bacterium]|nr:hypothetical protein [Candidatus Gastranaerophilaceae bacterium]
MAAGIQALLGFLIPERNRCTSELMGITDTIYDATERTLELNEKYEEQKDEIEYALDENPNNQEALAAREELREQYYCQLSDLKDFQKQLETKKTKLDGESTFLSASITSYQKMLSDDTKKNFTYGGSGG